MKNFEQLKKEINLIDTFENELGMMYQEIDDSSCKDIKVVRHFSNVKLLPIYVDLYNFIRKWIEYSILEKYVWMPELTEVCEDCVVRLWHVYHISICRYFDEDEPIIPPIQFSEMKQELLKELTNLNSSKQELVLKDVLHKTLLEPTGKTYFDSESNKFIIVEPKISVANLLDWKDLK